MNSAVAKELEYWTQSSGSNLAHEVGEVSAMDVTANFITHESVAKSQCESLHHPVWALPIQGQLRLLAKPVVLRVQKEGWRFFAENQFLDLCGYGESPREAVDDAVGDLAYFYSYYSSLREDQLVGEGLELQRRYRSLVL